METTPIELLEHHVEMLLNKLQQTEKDNFEYRNLLSGEIEHFQKSIIELKNIELK